MLKRCLAALIAALALIAGGSFPAHAEPVVQAHNAEVTRLEMVPGTDYVITAGADGSCSLLAYPDLRKVREVIHADSGLLSMAVSRDGKRVAVGDASGGLWLAWLWGNEAKQPPAHQAVAQDAALDLLASGDDTRFFSLMLNPAEMNPSIRTWESRTLTPSNWFQAKPVPALWAFSADRNTELIGAVSDTGHVVRWKVPQSLPARYPGQKVKYTCTATSPDGKVVYFADGGGGLWAITEARKEPVRLWTLSQPVASLTLDDSGQWIAIGLGRPSRKEIYRRTSLHQPYKAPGGGSVPIIVTRTSTWLAGQGTGGFSEKQSFTLPGPAGGTLCGAFSHNGKHFIAGGADGTVHLWLITDPKSRIQ
jgi:WD40 repeat protein